MSLATARWAPPAVALAVVAGLGVGVAVADRPDLAPSPRIDVLAPRDGASVDDGFLLAWRSQHAGERYAVVIDRALPAPGQAVEPGPHLLVVAGSAVRLTLGPRSGGSPSARDWHVITVLPLDSGQRRLGESVAVVRVRSRS